MKLNAQQEEYKNIWISTTGYRIFLELKALLEAPRTIDELINIVKNSPYFNKELSKDTIRFDLITLKSAGCKISRPAKSNNFKYQLIYHPFKLNISEIEEDILFEIRDNLASNISLNEVFILNDLFNKIAALTFDNEKIQKIADSQLFIEVNKDILKELTRGQIMGKKVQIKYNSPKFGIEDIDIIPIKVLYENKKIYLCAYNYKYKANSYLEVSKILHINSVSINNVSEILPNFKVIYEVKGEALNNFELKSYEKIIEQNSDKIRIEAEVSNEFMFTQRLMLLGRDFKIILPKFYKEKLINKIKLIQKGYQDE